MGTVPTSQLERELRALYLRWLSGLPSHQDVGAYIAQFEFDSWALIERLGGQAASLGALADFPVPKTLALSPRAGVIYNDMQQAGISASITAGLNPMTAARAMLHAGLDISYRRLERLARTETVSAYWKNQWDSTADLPMIVMIWGAENGPRTCDYCLERDGLVVEDDSIRDHPNGRCTLVPTLRTMVDYKGTLQADGSVYMDPAWDKPTELSPGDQEANDMLDAFNDGYEEVGLDMGGSALSVQEVTLSDGSEGVLKTLQGVGPFGQSAADQIDAEVLGSSVANVLGIDGVSSVQVSSNQVLSRFIDGVSGNQWMAANSSRYAPYEDTWTKVMSMPGARETGMLDYLIQNPDRHGLNWLVADGKVLPIDQGAALFSPLNKGYYETSSIGPFATRMMGIDYQSPMHTVYTTTQLDELKAGLMKLEPEFVLSDRSDWFNSMMNNLELAYKGAAEG